MGIIYIVSVEFPLPGDNVEEKGCCQIKDESKDNRGLVDNNTAQSLSSEDIDSMRRLESYAACSFIALLCRTHN